MQSFLHYLTYSFLLQGAAVSLEIASASLVMALVIGAALAELRTARLAPIRWLVAIYIWIIRGTPILLQLVFLYDALPQIGIVLQPIPTAIIGLTLNEAAFFAEIIRGGVLAVDRQQILAADALGMSPGVRRRRIIFPLAIRAILPSLGNEFINLIKTTSLASVISVNELTLRSQNLYSQNFDFFPVFIASGVMYLVLTSGVAVLQTFLERHVSLERNRKESPLPELVATEVTLASQLPVPLNNAPLIVIDQASKSYGDRTVLNGVDLKVQAGEVVAIIGASGSGKSTLLRLINHLEDLSGGWIFVGGQTVGYTEEGETEPSPTRLARARAEARIGMVFQNFNLFPHLTVLDNVRIAPMRVLGVNSGEATKTALGLLAAVGLSEHVHKLPHKLSGGQQQRVAIARALATKPRVMLFDEPTSALDPELVGEVLAVMRRLADEGMTMLVVTHEIRFARDVADRIVFIEEGRVIEDGPPDQVLVNPQQPQTRRFLQSLAGSDA